MKGGKEFYDKLKKQLDEATVFPSDYLYKFIVASDDNNVANVLEIFDNKGAVIKTRKSKNGTYNSISIMIKVSSSEEVINYYKQAEKIEGIISL